MKALIMAAGYGKRLEPLTLAVPKPMVPVVNKPTMLHNIELLKQYGIKDIIANIHYCPDIIKNYFKNGSSFGVKLSYSYEERLLGTAGGVKKMAKEIGKIRDTFVVLSSDALTDINLKKLIDYHKKKKALATLALFPVEDPSHYGVVALDDNDRIGFFQEKPPKEDAISNLVNTGIYVFEPEILKLIPDGFFDFGKELFPKLASEREAIYGYKMIEYWSDIGNLDQYLKANIDAMQGIVRIAIPGKRESRDTYFGKNIDVDNTALFDGPVILGNNVKIGKNVEIIGGAVIGDNCIIEDEVEISKSVIWADTHIGKNSKIENSVIGAECRIEENVLIDEGCIVGNKSNILAGVHLGPSTKIS